METTADHPIPICDGCGYNLTGVCTAATPLGACPECGDGFDYQELVTRRTPRCRRCRHNLFDVCSETNPKGRCPSCGSYYDYFVIVHRHDRLRPEWVWLMGLGFLVAPGATVLASMHGVNTLACFAWGGVVAAIMAAPFSYWYANRMIRRRDHRLTEAQELGVFLAVLAVLAAAQVMFLFTLVFIMTYVGRALGLL